MIPLIDLKLNTFQMLTVGRQRSMRECVMITINVNSGGTFAMMNEGQTLILTIAALIGITLILNGCAEFFIRII